MADLARQRRLRDVQLLSRPGKMQFVGYRNHTAQLPHLDLWIHDGILVARDAGIAGSLNRARADGLVTGAPLQHLQRQLRRRLMAFGCWEATRLEFLVATQPVQELTGMWDSNR